MSANTALQAHNLNLSVLLQLQLIGVCDVEQLRVLLAMRDKIRSQIVTALRRAGSKQIALTNTTDPEVRLRSPVPQKGKSINRW